MCAGLPVYRYGISYVLVRRGDSLAAAGRETSPDRPFGRMRPPRPRRALWPSADDARTRYETVLQLLQATGDRESLGVVYHQLGAVAQEQRRFGEAEASYRQALNITLESGDRHIAARTYHQLGTVALEQRRFAEAEASYRQALDIKLESGDRHSAANTYHQLGTVAQKQRRFAEAEASYRQALDICLESGDRHLAANTYHQFGRVALEQERFGEAEASYRQALDIYLEFGDQRSASRTATQLGIVYARLGQHHQAARILLYAAASWHQETGQWATQNLQWLHRQRAAIGTEEFRALMTAEVPAGITDELTAAIDKATDPEEDGESTA